MKQTFSHLHKIFVSNKESLYASKSLILTIFRYTIITFEKQKKNTQEKNKIITQYMKINEKIHMEPSDDITLATVGIGNIVSSKI